MTTQQAVRRWIMTGAVTAITVTGSLYGAGLNEHLKVRKVSSSHSTVAMFCRRSIRTDTRPSSETARVYSGRTNRNPRNGTRGRGGQEE